MSDVVDTAPDTSRGVFGRWRADPGALAAALILILGGWASLSVDAVQAGDGIKGDEATYVAMAFSVAYDRDLTYERRDLERFKTAYEDGPDGIFLKRGRELHLGLSGWWPPELDGELDRRTDRLYFGKAFILPRHGCAVRLDGRRERHAALSRHAAGRCRVRGLPFRSGAVARSAGPGVCLGISWRVDRAVVHGVAVVGFLQFRTRFFCLLRLVLQGGGIAYDAGVGVVATWSAE